MKHLALWLWLAPALACQAQPKFKAVKENLGPLVNDSQDQLLPFFSPNHQTLFFSQNTGPNERYEVWQAPLAPGGGWGNKQRAIGSPAGLDQYVFGAYPPNLFLINGKFADKANADSFAKGFSWYRAEGGQFSPKHTASLEIEGLDEMLQGQFANVFYHPGRRVLLLSFATDGKRDLYYCLPKAGQTDPPQQWQRPAKLPGTVNSNFEDSCPFLDDSGTVLYFSSDRPGGFGKDDIYCSKLLSEDFGQWSPAQNLGFFVNSNQSELYYSISPTDSLAYFVSYKNSYGAGDIFRIKFVMENNWPGQPSTALPQPVAQPSPEPVLLADAPMPAPAAPVARCEPEHAPKRKNDVAAPGQRPTPVAPAPSGQGGLGHFWRAGGPTLCHPCAHGQGHPTGRDAATPAQ
jgi:WD40-like Beta Propeller Repeat